jgi:hypothetical protein
VGRNLQAYLDVRQVLFQNDVFNLEGTTELFGRTSLHKTHNGEAEVLSPS